jgi:hypothetical protein
VAVSTVYAINVGANTSHRAIARSPIFPDGSFVYVSFPTKDVDWTQVYAGDARRFVRNPDGRRTHADPDWERLTYGDVCANPRAGALKRVVADDILLFWGLLWANGGSDWSGFTGARDWYLLGALRVAEILCGGESLRKLSESSRARAAFNAHLQDDEPLRKDHRIFVGDLETSRRFSRAIGLGVSIPDGLIYQTFMASSGQHLSFNGKPAWKSSLRSCRPIWNLERPADRALAQVVRDAIAARDDFDLLTGL